MFERFCTVCSEKTVFYQNPPPHCPHCESPYPPEIFSAKTVELDEFPSSLDETSSQNLSDPQNLSQQQTQDLDPALQIAPSEAMTLLTDSRSILRETVCDLEDSSANSLIPGEYFGKYKILEKIAQGGMGAVFKVFHPILHQQFALKILLSGQNVSEHQLARFHQEAKSCSRIRHKHIVSVHDVGEINGIHYLTMDLIEGSDLSKVLYAKSFEIPEAVLLVKKICEALAYAHAENILHRDLKPGNILMDRNFEPYVTDFGLAKDISKKDHLTQEGSILGTPAYMPPEQATGELLKVGPPSDIYSLGAIFYEVLTGRCPLMGETSIDLFHKILNVEPDPIRKINPKIPQDLETICLKCLAKEPKDRYPQMKDLLEDLNNYIEGRPIKARPVTLLERGWKLIKRHKLFTATFLVFSLLLLVAFLSFWWISEEKNRLLQNQQQITRLFEEAERLEKDPQSNIQQLRHIYNQALTVDWDHHKTYLKFAHFLSGRGLLKEAIQVLQNGLQRYPSWSEGYHEIALLYQNTNQIKEYQEARERFYQLAIQVEGTAEDLFLKAHQASQENNIEQAIHLYNEVLKKNPALIDARHNRAQLFMKKNFFLDAKEDLNVILKEQPNLVLPLLNRARVFLSLEEPDTKKAQDDLRHILGMNKQIPEVWILLIQSYYQESDSKKMQQILEEALKALPEHPLLLQEQGKMAAQESKIPEAITLFQQALHYDPTLLESHSFLVRIYTQQERFEEALECARKMVAKLPSEEAPFFLEAQSLYVFLLCRLGHRERFTALKNFSAHDPPYTKIPEDHLTLFIKEALAYRDDPLFEKLTQAMLEKRPSHTSTHAFLARKALYSGNEAQYKKSLENAKKGYHNKIKESFWMIRFFLEEQDIASAEALLTTLQKSLPKNPDVFKATAEIFLAKNQLEDAKQAIQVALQYKKDWLEALCLEGLIECAQENPQGLQPIEYALQQGGVTYKKYLGQGMLLLKQGEAGWKEFSVPSDYFFEEFALLAARFAFQKNDVANALLTLESVLKLNPNSFDALLLKAHCLMQQNQKEEVRKVLEVAKKLRINDLQLATLLQKLNKD